MVEKQQIQPKTQRIILFPGLAADERMYAGLGLLPVPLVTPRLLVPESGETMAAYARRHVEIYAIGPEDIVGGTSFGSMVAAEICRQQSARALVLLSGALSSAALVKQSRKLNRLAAYVPFFMTRRLLMSSFFLHAVFGDADSDQIELGRAMIRQTPKPFLLAAGYQPTTTIQCPLFALHGGHDRVIRAPQLDNVELIDDAGHGMVVSHAGQVTEFLCRLCQQVAGDTSLKL